MSHNEATTKSLIVFQDGDLDKALIERNQSLSTQTEEILPESLSLQRESKALCHKIEGSLEAPDGSSCLSYCEDLAGLFMKASLEDQKHILKDIRDIFTKLKRRLKQFFKDKQDQITLMKAMLCLIETVLEWSEIRPEDRFNFHYHVYWCAKTQPLILRESYVLEKVRAALVQARACVRPLIQTLELKGQFPLKVLDWMVFWNRVGQLYLAHWKYECISASELPSLLEQAVEVYKKVANPGVGVNFENVKDNRKMIVGCCHWLGRIWTDQGNRARADHYFQESKRWFNETVSDVERIESNARPGDLHSILAHFYFDQEEFEEAERQALLAAEQSDHNSENFEDLQETGFFLFLNHLVKTKSLDAINLLENILTTDLTIRLRLMVWSALHQLYAAQRDMARLEAAKWFFIKAGEKAQLPEIVQLTKTQKSLLLDLSLMPAYVEGCKNRLFQRGRP